MIIFSASFCFRLHLLSYSSWRRHQTPVSLRPLGARSAVSPTLSHFAADGLMVLVNAPVPCPDNAVLRAIRMAEDMQAAVQTLIVGWRARGHVMGFGVGLATGAATVGRVGYEGRHDYTAIGYVANLASRLCSSAEDGQILIDSEAAAGVAGVVAVAPLGTRMLKGFAEPVLVYAVATMRFV